MSSPPKPETIHYIEPNKNGYNTLVHKSLQYAPILLNPLRYFGPANWPPVENTFGFG